MRPYLRLTILAACWVGAILFFANLASAQADSTRNETDYDCTSGVLFETWTDIPGLAISDLIENEAYPNSPDTRSNLSTLEIPRNQNNNFGVRLRAFVIPPQSGTYEFWISSDDNGSLLLSSDQSAENAIEIASVPAWTFARQWDKYESQHSAAVELVAGQPYYIEALMKEWGGMDNLAIAWSYGDEAREVIAEEHLCVFENDAAPAPFAVAYTEQIGGESPYTAILSATESTDNGEIVSYEWAFGDGTSAMGAVVTHTYVGAGHYDATLTVTDNGGLQGTDTVEITVTDADSCEANGVIYERFDDITGLTIESLTSNIDYPYNPAHTEQVSGVFEAPMNIGENYGVRMWGYLQVSVSAEYTFWIASDDNGSLRLSTDSEAANAVEIATVSSWTPPRQWDWYTEQQSAPVYLVAGEQYYIEALMKEFGGLDNLAVAWQREGTKRELIPDVNLCPVLADRNQPPIAVVNASPFSGEAPLPVTFDGFNSLDLDGTIESYAWDFGDGTFGTGITATHVFGTPGLYDVTLTVTDDGGLSNSQVRTIEVTEPVSNINCDINGAYREVWTNIWSSDVSALVGDSRFPDLPTYSETLSSFTSPSNIGDGYGARTRAYLVAPETGVYQFYLTSDNEGQLFLSSDDDPENVTQIAQTIWAPEQDWNSSWTSVSAEISLVEGEAYYIEGLHQTSFGSDYYAVGWTTPSNATPSVLSPSALCMYQVTASRLQARSSSQFEPATMISSPIVQQFPIEHYGEFALVFASNQPIRELGAELRDDYIRMMQEDEKLSAEFIKSVTDLYKAVHAEASPELAQELELRWTMLNNSVKPGMDAAEAWDIMNSLELSPTSVSLSSAGVYSFPAIALLTIALVCLTLAAYIRPRKD